MIYNLVRPVARYILRYYFRNIDLTGLENIPKNAAVILAANHPTAFIEPCILACFQPRTLWFLARGNLFKNRAATALLNAVNILPIYRRQDGDYEKLKDNFNTFAECYRALSRHRAIMILSEGRTIHEKALRRIRKGTARIALGALQNDSTLKEVYIVPIGCNYTHAHRVRSQVMVRCGEPISAAAYMDEYRRSEATAIKNLTEHLRARLSSLVVQFPEHDRAGIGESRLELDRVRHNTQNIYGITHDGQQLDRELAIAASTPAEAPELTRYFNRLQHNDLGPSASSAEGAVAGAVKGTKKQRATWFRAAFGLLLQLPHLPLWLIGEYIADNKVNHVEFYSPVRFAALAIGTFVLVPLGLFFLPWPLKIWLVLALLSVNWSIRQWETLARQRQSRRWRRLVDQEREWLEEKQEVSA